MKIFAACAVGCVLIFLAMGYQAGLFDDEATEASASTPPPDPEKRLPKGPRARFPDALVEAIRGKPVPEAAPYQKTRGPHRMVIFDNQGQIHDWQEALHEDWQADSVETAELIIVCGKNVKTMVQHIQYRNAPAVSRYRHDMDVYVVAAKTAEVLAKKRFVSMPRPIENVEAWELTALGGPVQFRNVFDWIAAQCPLGFPQDPSPIINLYRNN
jgi:hypothetical protein